MKKTFLIAFAAIFLPILNAYSQKTWNGTTTNWNTASNWTPSGVPTSTTAVTINSTSVTPTLPAGTFTVASITMTTNSATKVPSLALSAGTTLNVTGAITVNYSSINNTAATITGGTGAILNASSMTIDNNNTGNTNTAGLTLSVPIVNLTGNLIVSSQQGNNSSKLEKATFTLAAGSYILTANGLQTTNTTNNTNIVSTFAFNTGNTLNFTGTDALSTLSSNGTNTITGLNGITIGYTGTNNQVVYTDAAVAHSSLTSGISYTNIVFDGSGIKTPAGDNTNSLNVSGDFTNSLTSNTTDTYVDLSTPTLNLTGTGQALAGGSGVGTKLYNTVLTGGAKTMSGTFTLDSHSLLSMGSGSTSSTTLDAGSGSLTLSSDATGSASIGALANSSGTVTGVINGTVNVQRYITGNNSLTYRGYRLLSSAVSDASSSPARAYYNLSFLRGFAADNVTVNSGSYFTGPSGQTNGFDATGNPSAYFYREDVAPATNSFASGNYRYVLKINNSPLYNIGINTEGNFNMPVGNGVLFFYRGNNGTNATTAPGNLTFTMTGSVNQGKITVKPWFNSSSSNLSYTATSGPSDPRLGIVGFNLVGNPYPSSIDWNTAYNNTNQNYGIYAPNTDQTIYIYNAASKNYGAYLNTATPGGTGTNGTTNIIPAGQGFFVRATSASAQLIFNETAKVNSQPGTLLLNSAATVTPSQRLRLQFAKDDINKDETIIVLNNKAHNEYIKNEDALYMTGNGVVGLSNISVDNKALAISQLPMTSAGQTIPLKIRASAQGAYTLNLAEGQDLPTLYNIWLKDAYTKDSTDLKHNPTYSFSINADTASTGSKRFSVVVGINSGMAVHLLNFNAVKGTSSVNITWTAENENNYTTYVLQRSTDNGRSFSTLDSLTSASLGTYNDIDPNPVNGANMYRLKQIDLFGNVSYSNVVTVMYSLPGIIVGNSLNMYPNPTKNAITLTIRSTDNKPIKGKFNITMTNSMGIVVQSGSSNQPEWHTDVNNLMPGTYFIEVINLTDNSFIGRSSFIKM